MRGTKLQPCDPILTKGRLLSAYHQIERNCCLVLVVVRQTCLLAWIALRWVMATPRCCAHHQIITNSPPYKIRKKLLQSIFNSPGTSSCPSAVFSTAFSMGVGCDVRSVGAIASSDCGSAGSVNGPHTDQQHQPRKLVSTAPMILQVKQKDQQHLHTRMHAQIPRAT